MYFLQKTEKACIDNFVKHVELYLMLKVHEKKISFNEIQNLKGKSLTLFKK